MLSVAQLTCQRGERILFSDLSFDLPEGQWLHVAGANGAGKTTLLRTLAGLAEPAVGTVRWNGRVAREDREAFNSALLYLGHQGALKEELTPLENLELGLGMEGLAIPPDKARDALQRFGLAGREHLPVRVLSAGQRRRVLLCRLLLRPASLWILDEPFTALDSHATATLLVLLETHVASGGSVVLTSHHGLTLSGGQSITL
jgi:heme exporter protein A